MITGQKTYETEAGKLVVVIGEAAAGAETVEFYGLAAFELPMKTLNAWAKRARAELKDEADQRELANREQFDEEVARVRAINDGKVFIPTPTPAEQRKLDAKQKRMWG